MYEKAVWGNDLKYIDSNGIFIELTLRYLVIINKAYWNDKGV